MRDICAVVVTYNRKELLKENIEALINQNYKSFDILVVDNNSTDGTKEYIENYIKSKKIMYMNTEKNLGGAGGFNFGIKECMKKKYKYIWIMDDDTIPEKNALESIVNKKEFLKDKFSFICSLVKFNEKDLCVMNVPTINGAWLDEYYNIENGLVKLNSCSFVSCFVNANVVKKVGLPIKEFFIYGDDCEYTERLTKVLPGYIDINSVVNHKMKVNVDTKIAFVEKERIDRAYFTYRNTFYIAKKNGIKKVIRYLFNWFQMFFIIIFKSPTAKLRRLRVLIKGFIAGIFFNPKIEMIEE